MDDDTQEVVLLLHFDEFNEIDDAVLWLLFTLNHGVLFYVFVAKTNGRYFNCFNLSLNIILLFIHSKFCTCVISYNILLLIPDLQQCPFIPR